MSLEKLQTILNGQASSGKVAINKTTFDQAELDVVKTIDDIIQCSLRISTTTNLTIFVDTPIPSISNKKLSFAGKVSLFNMNKADCNIVFEVDDLGLLQFNLEISLPQSWKFSDAFPELSQEICAQILISSGNLIFTTISQNSYAWQKNIITIVEGLNFVGNCAWSTSGPFKSLVSGLALPPSVNTIMVHGNIGSYYQMKDQTNPDIPYISLNAGLPHLFTFTDIAKVITGNITLPNEIQNIFSGINITKLFISLSFPTLNIENIGFTIGASTPLSWGELSIEDMKMGYNINLPTTTNQSTQLSFNAKCQFLPNLFQGDFNLQIIYNALSKDFFIRGTFQGNLSLSNVFKEISGQSLTLPSFLPQINFTDFGVIYQKSGGYSLSANGNIQTSLKLAGMDIAADFSTEMTHDVSGANSYNLIGNLSLGNYDFITNYNLSSSETKDLTAIWQDDGSYSLGINDLIKALDPNSTFDIPSDIDMSLTQARLNYNATNDSLSFSCQSANYGEIYIESRANSDAKERISIVFINFNIDIGSSDLPVIGSKVGDVFSLSDIGILMVDGGNVTTVNVPLIKSGELTLQNLIPGIYFAGNFNSGSETTQISALLDKFTSKKDPTIQTIEDKPHITNLTTVNTSSANEHASYISLQKQIGPIYISQIGFSYNEGILDLLFNISLNFSSLIISLQGLSIGSSIKEFKPEFSLQGLGLELNNPPLEMAGDFYKVPVEAPIDYQFDGAAILKTSSFSLSAVGSYAQISGLPSMFIFAHANVPIGGPPSFFIDGVLGGFGVNRSIRIPSQDEIYSFPFVAGFTDPSKVGGTSPTPMQVLAAIEGAGSSTPWITDKIGANWLALGINFNSYHLVDSTAVFIAEFGDELAFSIIGLSRASFPQNSSTKFAYVELGIEAVFKPEEGILKIVGGLTPNSFVIDQACHLTGGFAFCFWFGNNPNSGQFVVTVGGFNPNFSVPSFYPVEPRLGFNWQISSLISIKGGAYFALTPSAIMAGGSLEILFHDGNIKAWFTAYADFLISWKPFYYSADIGVNIGVSYRINLLFVHTTLSLSIGATLSIWGPETSGEAHISLYIVSFSVSFGASENSPSGHLPWTHFKSLLPSSANYCKINSGGGLLKQDKTTGTWEVRANNFNFSTNSSIPASNLCLAKPSTISDASSDNNVVFQSDPINIRPMGLSNINSSHILTVTSSDGTTIKILDLKMEGWGINKNTQNTPEGMWGSTIAKGDSAPLSAKTIADQLIGFAITAPPLSYGANVGPINTKTALSYAPLPEKAIVSLSNSAVPIGKSPIVGGHTIAEIEATLSNTATSRAIMVKSLSSLGDFSNGSNLSGFIAQVPNLYRQEPMLSTN